MATQAAEILKPAPFGTVFTHNMVVNYYSNGVWGSHTLDKTAPFSLHPGAHVFHYASTCFEGLKAYRRDDGSVHIFRLGAHIERMRQSARLLQLPEPDAAVLRDMILEGVRASRSEIPAYPGALYIRPTLIGTQVNIGAAATATTEATLFVLFSPVGDYFQGGQRPLRILVEDQAMRATPEFGMAKTGGSYAAALSHITRAKNEYQADQVLFCPGGDVQETGAANFLLINDNEILTKQLDSSFLHGVTRDSALTIAPELGYKVSERNFNVDEMLDWVKTGEAALSGTAAVLAGVGTLIYKGQEYSVGTGNIGTNTEKLRSVLTELQSGEAKDAHGWLTNV